MNEEGYGTTHRGEMMKSMEYPAKAKLSVIKTPPNYPQPVTKKEIAVKIERRRAPKLQRLWWDVKEFWSDYGDTIGKTLWIIAALIVMGMAWLAFTL